LGISKALDLQSTHLEWSYWSYCISKRLLDQCLNTSHSCQQPKILTTSIHHHLSISLLTANLCTCTWNSVVKYSKQACNILSPSLTQISDISLNHCEQCMSNVYISLKTNSHGNIWSTQMFHNCNENAKNPLQPVYIILANVKKQIAHVLEKNIM